MPVSITALGTAITQNFDTLSAAGTTNVLGTAGSALDGWVLTEGGNGARDNEQYGADTGGSNTADTYSYGAAAATDRALGGLRSGSLIPTFGAFFTNDTGTTITSVTISFTGEQWRLGTAARTVADRLDFQINTAPAGMDILTGSWADVDALDFSGATAGAVGLRDGNLAANRSLIMATITGLNIAAGQSFGIRWTDFDAPNADDGLAIDDFSLTAAGAVAFDSTLSVADVEIAEGAQGTRTDLTFTVTRTGLLEGSVEVDYSIANGTTDAADFAAAFPAGRIVFLDGESSKTITVQIAGDAQAEANETFTVTLSNPLNAGITDGTATGTIINDDVAGTLAIAAASVAEGNAGTTALTFTVTRSGGSDGAVSATWTATLGTATGDDLSGPLSGTASFANGETSATVTVNVVGDAVFEADETITVTLSAPTGGATIPAAGASATGTILNDDLAPAFGSISIADASGAEGASGVQSIGFTLTREGGSTGTVTVDYAITPGTASADDLDPAQPLTGTVTFAEGQTQATLLVGVRGDTLIERDENFTITLSNSTGGATILDGGATGTITNDDSSSAVFINEFHYDDAGDDSLEAIELAGPAGTDLTGWTLVLYNGTNSSTYATLTLSGTIPDQNNGYGTLNFAAAGLENGSPDAMALVDASGAVVQFLSYEGVLTAANGPAAGLTSIDVGVAETGVTDGFSLQLTGSGTFYSDFTWAQAAQNTAGAINTGQSFLPADQPGAFRAGDVAVVEGDAGTTALTFVVTRSGGSALAASVGYTIDLGTVSADDIGPLPLTGTLDFAVGVSTRTVTITVNGDQAPERNEALTLTLSDPTNGTTISDPSAVGTITNDDPVELFIYEIQGAAQASSYLAQQIVTSGIVTAINANSFWIQDPTGDANRATSDAIQVFVGSVNPGVAIGQQVQVSAIVDEFRPSSAATSLSVTQLTAPTITILNATPQALPAAVLIGANGGILPPTSVIDDDGLTSYDPTTDGIDFYESLEGMLVTVQAPLVVSTSDGRTTYIVASGGQGATGINDRGGITIAADDVNPERIQLFADSRLLPGYTPNHSQGDILADVTGIMTYFAFPELLPTQAVTTTTDVTLVREQTALRGDADRLSIASFNIENADPGDGARKFQAIATEIVSGLGSPDIIGVQEVQDADGAGGGTNLSGQATAQAIIDAVIAAGGPTYAYVEVAPTTAGTTGGEPGGNIRNGYLYIPTRVAYVDGSATLIEDPAYNNSRRPLIAQFVFNDETITVVNAHSTSRGGSDLAYGTNQPPSNAGDGARLAQGAAIKAYIDGRLAADPNANIVTLGDFNGFYFEQSLTQFTADGKLTNLYDLLPVQERYSYIFEGQNQTLDNMIVTNNLLDQAAFDVVHYNSHLAAGPDRATDHDQPLATLYIPRNTAPTDLTIDTAAIAENAPAGTLVGTVTGVDAQGGTLTYALVDDAAGRFAIDAANGRLTTAVTFDREATATAAVTVRVTDSRGLSYGEALTITVTDVNEAPAAPTLAGTTVAENAAAGTLVGTVSAIDPEGAALRYTLVDDAGGRFAVDAATGRLTTTATAFDFEATRSAAVTVRATDAGGLTADSAFTITVTDVNEAPSIPTINTATVAENAAAGTLVGTVSATDPEGAALRYTLVDDAGGRFAVDAATGRLTTTATAFDFEATRSAAVTIRATDAGGLTADRAITVAVSNVNEAPVRVSLPTATVTENAAAGTVIGTLSGNDPDAGDAVTFRLNGTDARFRIEGAQLIVAAGAVIDYEVERTIPLSITATDGAGLTVTTALTLSVGDVAEAITGTPGNDTLVGDAGDNSISGGAGNDTISGGAGNDTIDGGDGNDILSGGPGTDRLTLGAGTDQVRSLLGELVGDTIVDFGLEDRLIVLRSDLQRADLRTSGTTLTIGTTALTLTAPLTGGDLMLAHQGNDSIITFHQYLANLTEGTTVAGTAINGITNQAYLAGATSTAFTVQVDTAAQARFNNTLGVYEIDTATGALLDVRIIAGNVKGAGSISVTGVEVGRQLGFFIVQDGANILSSAVLGSTNLSFIQQNGGFVLANNGTAVAGATTFLSHAASANVDGAQHVVSGVASDGSGNIRISFEDLLRNNRSDDDFQDVVLTVQAVPQPHPVSVVPDAGVMMVGVVPAFDPAGFDMIIV